MMQQLQLQNNTQFDTFDCGGDLMIVELISTGSELLLGDTVNTNVSWLAQELNK